jgi:streptogramin lyase
MRRTSQILLAVLALALMAGAPAALGEPVGIARVVPTRCPVRAIAAGEGGAVWFTCFLATDSGYSGRAKVGRVEPSGQVREFAGTFPKGGEPGPIAVAADGDVWFGLNSVLNTFGKQRIRPQLARVDADGKATIVPTGLPASEEIGQVVASPDGYLWFTAASEQGTGPSLWQISPQGQPSRLPIDVGPNGAFGLEVGPDGNLWFRKKPASGPATSVLARLTPAGELTEYGAGIAGFAPGAGVPTADGGRLFIAGSSPIGVDRLTPAGEVLDTGARINSESTIVGGVTLGTDGNLWFTLQGEDPHKSAVGRVTASGQVSEFHDCLRYGQPFFGPDDIVQGARGDLWFTSIESRELPGISDPPSIGRVTEGGRITQIYAGVRGEPNSVLAAPDGSIWFTTYGRTLERVAPIEGRVNTFRVGRPFFAGADGSTGVRMNLPGPGAVTVKPLVYLYGKGLRRQTKIGAAATTSAYAACGSPAVPLKPAGAARRAFAKTNRAWEKVRVTFTPTGGTPYSEIHALEFLHRTPKKH